jgi:hypothetical protein
MHKAAAAGLQSRVSESGCWVKQTCATSVKKNRCETMCAVSVLLPLLWSLVVEDPLWGLNSNGYYTAGYADDIAILINGKFLQTVSEVLQTALWAVQQWCEKTDLSINTNKMVIIPFTRKRNMKGLKESMLYSKTIQLSCGT